MLVQVEHDTGAGIGISLREPFKGRLLTHDLMNNLLTAFGITVERVAITELGLKLAELDACVNVS